MKTGRLLGALAAILAVLAITAVACGGDSGDDKSLSADEIRTQKGIVSAAGAGIGGPAGLDADATEGNALASGPAPQVVSFDEGGVGGDRAVEDVAGLGDFGFAPGPYQQGFGGGTGITVQGYGTASADADSARVELWFSRYSEKDFPVPEPAFEEDVRDADGSTSSGSSGSNGVAVDPLPPEGSGFDDGLELQEVEPITEEDLQPVIDALVDAGVSRSDIEFVGQTYYDPYYANASLRVTIDNIDDVEGVVEAAGDAAANLDGVNLDSSNASYTVSDCSALQKAALETAIEDAGDSAAIFAEALGVGVGEVIGAANFSYFPSDGSGCESYFGYYPIYEDFAFRGAENSEVQAYANVSITYAIQ